jgi:hypothetical protein
MVLRLVFRYKLAFIETVLNVRTYVYKHVCMHVCMYVCMYVCSFKKLTDFAGIMYGNCYCE